MRSRSTRWPGTTGCLRRGCGRPEPLHQRPDVLAIPGTAKIAQLEADVAALRLSEKDLVRLAGV